ncbi:adhesion G protein-coupled receptor A3-like isoform X3 [Symsagittifera roscoffensis]|uniref:adhesion G protein-coupled receptor A3-like isoform X3 n=1 Tax=Symsagittifera roscoffensis TaxID=84072 RepID=UPI00307BF842
MPKRNAMSINYGFGGLSLLVCMALALLVHGVQSCPYYCTCSNQMNRCSNFEVTLPSAEVMRASSGGGGLDGGSRWDFSQGNNISLIELDSFLGLDDITYLNLSHNRIERIPDGAFKPLKNLQVLDLSHNNLRQFSWKMFEGLSNLKVLNISYNLNWFYPQPNLFDNLTSLETLSIANPYLYCRCEFIESITQLKNRTLNSKMRSLTISEDTICNENMDSEFDVRGPKAKLLNNRFSVQPDVCETAGQGEKQLPVYETYPPAGSTQLLFEQDSMVLNCSVTLPSDYEVVWSHKDSIIGRFKVRERLGLDITVKDLAPNGVVTLFSVAIEKLDESHAGEWSCLIKSESNDSLFLPAKTVSIEIIKPGAVFCPTLEEETTKGSFNWPKTVAGHQQTLTCPFGRSEVFAREPSAYKMCSENGTWQFSDFSTCQFRSELSKTVTRLFMESELLLKTVFSSTSGDKPNKVTLKKARSIAENLSNVTTWSSTMENVEDVTFSALTVQNLYHYMNRTEDFNEAMLSWLMETVSNAMSFNALLLLEAEQQHHSCTMLTHYLQSAIFHTVDTKEVHRENTHNIAVRVFKIHQLASFTGYTCALLVSSDGGRRGGGRSGTGVGSGVSFKTGAQLECQDGVQRQQNVSTLLMGHPHFNKIFAVVKVASPYISTGTLSGSPVPTSLTSLTSSGEPLSKFFKLQVVVFRNASLFPSADVAIVSPVASAKIVFGTFTKVIGDALIGQIAPTTVFADPNMTAVSSPFVRTKPLHADLALFYGPGGSEYELSSGGGFKLGAMTASTWVVQKRTREINESEEKVSVSQFDNFDLEGSWIPTGGAGCRVVSTLFHNMSEVQCDSLATVAISTLLSPLSNSLHTVDAAIQVGCAVCAVFTLLLLVTYIAFKSCIFIASESLHVICNFSIAIFFLCVLFAFGNVFSDFSDSISEPPESSAPVYLQSAYLFEKQQHAGVPYLACSLIFVAIDYFLLSAALWLILYNRNLCCQFEKIEEKHGHHQMQHNIMGAAAAGSAVAGAGGGGGGGGANQRQAGLPSTKTKKQISKLVYRLYIICWGLPLIVCLASSFFSLKFHSSSDSQTDSGALCWISPTVAAVTSFLPVALCLVFSSLYMVKTLLIIPKLPRKLEVRQQCFNPSEHTHPNMCSNGPLYLDGELELSALTDNESMHSSVIGTGLGGLASESNNNRFSRQTNTSANGAAHNYVTATFSVKADSACCRQLRSALILFILFFASWMSAALLVFADFHPMHRLSTFKVQISVMFAVSCTLMGAYMFLKFCLFRSDVKQCYIASITCQQTVSFPKPSQITHSLYLKHHNSYLSLESGMNGGGSSHPSSYHPGMSLKQSLQNQTTSVTFSGSSDCVRNNGAFYNPGEPYKASQTSRSHDKCRTVFPANLRNTASSRSGSSVRGGIDEELASIPMDNKGMLQGSSSHLGSMHQRSQNNHPEGAMPPWQVQQLGLMSQVDHDGSRVGVNSPIVMMQQTVPYNTGVLAGRNTPVSIPPTPLGQPNKGPMHGKGGAIYNPLLSSVNAPSPQYSPGGSNLSVKQGTVDPFLTNRCNTPSSSLSQPPPDLLQSYYATRNAKLKSAAKSNTSGGSGSSRNQNRSQSQGRQKGNFVDPVGPSNVRDDSFSSDDSDDDEDDASSLGREIDESLRGRFQAPPSRHMNTSGAKGGGGASRGNKHSGGQVAHNQYKPRDQGETSV